MKSLNDLIDIFERKVEDAIEGEMHTHVQAYKCVVNALILYKDEFKPTSGLFDRDGIEICEGDLLSIPYVNPMGKLERETEDYQAMVVFKYGCYMVDKIPEPYPLMNWCKREKGEYVPNYGETVILSCETYVKVLK